VIVRKIVGSETGVIAKTRDPAALKGERGSILGLWTANRPGECAELVFRPDGQYQWKSCKLVLTNNIVYDDYGLYAVDMPPARRVGFRFIDVQTRQLDFYGDTLTSTVADRYTPDTYTSTSARSMPPSPLPSLPTPPRHRWTRNGWHECRLPGRPIGTFRSALARP